MICHRTPLAALPLLLLLFCAVALAAPTEPKRRNPEALVPWEFQTDVGRVGLSSYIIVEEGGREKFGILSGRGKVREIVYVDKNELKFVPGAEFAPSSTPCTSPL